MIASPAIPAIQRRRMTISAQRSQARLKVVEPCRTRLESSAGPQAASVTGSSVVAAMIATTGISIEPTPMLRRNGTGRTSSDSSPTATVTPLRTTAWPAVALEARIACLVLQAAFALFAPACDDQQRVVDRDAQPDECDQILEKAVHGDALLEAEHEQVGREDRRQRHQQRDDRNRRPKYERQDDERPEGADQRLDQHARAAPTPAAGRLQRLEPGHGHRSARRRGGPQRRLDPFKDARPERNVRVRHVDQRPRRAPVRRDELRVVGIRVVSDANMPSMVGGFERPRRQRLPGGVRIVWPAGSRRTAIAGCSLPSNPKRLRMRSLASVPAVPGADTECESPFVVDDAVSPPATAKATQPRTTRRR